MVLRLCERADVLLEGFRPGVAERLGVGPEQCRARNRALVYARMTGWGQTGPLAGDVGHDINYLSVAGVLWHLGPEGHAPVPPINLLADFGGGGSLVVMGILAALVERGRSGEGQVVDAAMIDGSAQLMSIFWGLDAMGAWGPRGTNLLDGGAHFYNVYETADGEYVSLAAYEPKFYANFLRLVGPLGFADLDPVAQMDTAQWPALKTRLADAVPHQVARRMGRVLRRYGSVLRTGASHVRGARASAQRCTRDVRRRGRYVAAGTGAALQSHDELRAGCTGETWRAHALRAPRLGLCRTRNCCAYRERRDRLDSGSPDASSSQVTAPTSTDISARWVTSDISQSDKCGQSVGHARPRNQIAARAAE